MKEKIIIQPEGNFYDKYHSGNIIVRKLMEGFFNSYKRLLSEIKTNIHSCLEGGVGEGEIAEFVYDYLGIKVEGFDISKQVIDEANTRLSGKDIHLWTGNIYDLQNTQKYDLVICSEVLEHLEHPEKAVAQLKKASEKYLIFSVPRERLWCFLNLCRGKYIKAFGNTPGHIQHWNKKSFVRFLRNNGLKIVRIESPVPWIVVLAEVDNTNSREKH